MDVYMIPVGTGRYALYCEPAPRGDTPADEAAPPSGLTGRLKQRLTRTLRELDERQQQPAAAPPPRRSIAGLQDRFMAFVAERVAEGRLLWNLRGLADAVIVHPEDMTDEQVMTLARRILQIDYKRHRLWAVLDSIAFLITFVALGPLFLLIPGIANIPAIYFGLRAIGHALSMRGAYQGLYRIAWSGRPSPLLGELREIGALAPEVRDARVNDIAARLRLQHLATFVARVSLRHA